MDIQSFESLDPYVPYRLISLSPICLFLRKVLWHNKIHDYTIIKPILSGSRLRFLWFLLSPVVSAEQMNARGGELVSFFDSIALEVMVSFPIHPAPMRAAGVRFSARPTILISSQRPKFTITEGATISRPTETGRIVMRAEKSMYRK